MTLDATTAQIVVATHSLATLARATVLVLGERGTRTTAWRSLVILKHVCAFLRRPDRYRHQLLG